MEDLHEQKRYRDNAADMLFSAAKYINNLVIKD